VAELVQAAEQRHGPPVAAAAETGATQVADDRCELGQRQGGGVSPAYTLSGGERRRAEITRALVMSPRFILLDEPFAGIDPIAVTDIQQIIFHLKTRGIGVLITDHNVRETLRITDRAYIVADGVIFKNGTPDKLAEDEDVRRIYLGTDFRLD
jgi:lipopolysaccharide export system ATP-binding protein